MKKFNYKLEIEIFRNSTLKELGVLRGSFLWFGCPKRHPDALLAKTMLHTIIRTSNPYASSIQHTDMIACHTTSLRKHQTVHQKQLAAERII